jgi:hypothetical protein
MAQRRTAVVMMKVVMMERPSKQLQRHCCVLYLSARWLGWVDQRETAKHRRCLGGWGISTLEMTLPRDGTELSNKAHFCSANKAYFHFVFSKQKKPRNCAKKMRTTNTHKKGESVLIDCS